MRLGLAVLFCLFLVGCTLFFAWAYYEQYWQWRECFNDEGRCYDPNNGMVFLEQAGIIWGGITLLCAFASLLAITAFCRRYKKMRR